MMMMIVQNFFWCFFELIDAWQGLLAACWATTVLCTFTQCRFHAWCHFTENSNKCGIREWWQPVLVPSRKPKQIRKPKHSLILVCSETSVTTNQYLDRNVLPSSFVTGIFVSSRIDENFALNSFFSFLSHEKDIRDRIDDAAVACCVYFYCGLPLPMPANLNGFKYMLVPLFIFEILIS